MLGIRPPRSKLVPSTRSSSLSSPSPLGMSAELQASLRLSHGDRRRRQTLPQLWPGWPSLALGFPNPARRRTHPNDKERGSLARRPFGPGHGVELRKERIVLCLAAPSAAPRWLLAELVLVVKGGGSLALIYSKLLARYHFIVDSLNVRHLDGGQLLRREQPLERLLVSPLRRKRLLRRH